MSGRRTYSTPAMSDADRLPVRSLDLPADVEAALLKEYRLQFEAGDRNALFRAIAHCGSQAIAMPEWVVAAYFNALNAWWSMEAKTLDEAFAVPLPKGKHLAALRKRRKFAPLVARDVDRLHASGRPINKALFAEVGKAHALGATLAEDYYRHWMRARRAVASAPDAMLEPYLTAAAKVARKTRKITKLSGSR